jgi:GNAT superfamily N-acetyltransferase
MTSLEIHPLTADRWRDLESLFGPGGASGGCWCMWWRTGPEFPTRKVATNKAAFKRVVAKGPPPGLIAYRDGKPAGWCEVCPRADLARLAGSRQLAPVDNKAVWSLPCFFVKRNARGLGIVGALIEEATRYARKHKAPALEAYPWDSDTKRAPAAVYTGVASTFTKAGFVEVARRAPQRPIMRFALK